MPEGTAKPPVFDIDGNVYDGDTGELLGRMDDPSFEEYAAEYDVYHASLAPQGRVLDEVTK